jgi:hypothetical protein
MALLGIAGGAGFGAVVGALAGRLSWFARSGGRRGAILLSAATAAGEVLLFDGVAPTIAFAAGATAFFLATYELLRRLPSSARN